MNYILEYLTRLVIMVVLLISFMYFVHRFEIFRAYLDLSIYSAAMFTVFSIVIYVLLKLALYNKDNQIFLSLTFINTLLRMAGSVLILVLYKYLKSPKDNYFVVSFLFVYIAFTIFETYFMVDLADQKSKK